MPELVTKLSRQKQAALSRMQQRFVQEYVAANGNGTQAARKAGYKGTDNALGVQAHDNLRLPKVNSAIAQELAKIDADVTPRRVQRRLHEISHAAQEAGQFGPAVRAEELLGKSIGMWIDQTLQLQGVLKDEHITALLDIARQRRAEPVELEDDASPHNEGTQRAWEG